MSLTKQHHAHKRKSSPEHEELKGSAPELEIEEPVLDLETPGSHGDLPEKVPDLLAGVMSDASDLADASRMGPIIKDVEIYLAIGDIENAKKLYKELNAVYASLPTEEKHKHFKDVDKLYKEIKGFNSFGKKFKRMFSSPKKLKK